VAVRVAAGRWAAPTVTPPIPPPPRGLPTEWEGGPAEDAEEVKALEAKAAADGGKGVLTITVSQDARLNCRTSPLPDS